jgi:hypothetical protein
VGHLAGTLTEIKVQKNITSLQQWYSPRIGNNFQFTFYSKSEVCFASCIIVPFRSASSSFSQHFHLLSLSLFLVCLFSNIANYNVTTEKRSFRRRMARGAGGGRPAGGRTQDGQACRVGAREFEWRD